jgi:uncharacterized protein (DUF1697 family)
MPTYVILLRGVAPTGKNKVLMAPLRVALTRTGLRDARTYIQSGNVIATSSLSQSKLEKLVHDTIKKTLGGDIVVVARTAEQFRKTVKRNPFPHADQSRLYFSLLASRPDPTLVKSLLSMHFSPDQVRVVDDAIYTLYATKYSDSKFNNNFFERRLKVAATTRNFNTMTKLVELSSVSSSGSE